MAVVSGMTSTLNPDAPLFIPAAFDQVENFSAEWWELVKTSTWFRDYWLSQHQEEASFIVNDVANLLPDHGVEEESSLEAQMQEWDGFMEYQNELMVPASSLAEGSDAEASMMYLNSSYSNPSMC